MNEPEPITGDEFLDALWRALPVVPNEELEDGGAWSAWMFEHLHEVQRSLDLYCSCKSRKEAHKSHERREYIYDFTWYNRRDDYTLPCVLIEHENARSELAFLDDQWKLLFGWAPLRVMFGYTAGEGGFRELLSSLNEKVGAMGWTFPDGVEDIALIGHARMSSRGFRVLRRRPGERRWSDAGILEAWDRQ